MKNIVEILVALACVYGVFVLIFRIIWLYFPYFLQGKRIYKLKEPVKIEMLFYFLAGMLCMCYVIVNTIEKLL
jgi:hypothetical protein